MGLPVASNRQDSIWVIVDRLTKIAYFILVRANYSMDKLAQVYVAEIVRLQGALVTIVLIGDHSSPQGFGILFKMNWVPCWILAWLFILRLMGSQK